MATIYVGTSGVNIIIDSLAGTPGMIPTLAGATCALVIALNVDPRQGTNPSRVQVPSGRFTSNGDNRTYTYALVASDVPYPGIYSIQMIAELSGGITLPSEIGTLTVLASL